MKTETTLAEKDLFPRFSEAEYLRRTAAIHEAMDKDGLEAILISGARGSSDIHYLSNYLAQSPCWLLFPRRGEPTVFVHFFNHQPCAKAQSIIEDVRWYGPTPMPTIVDEMRKRGLGKAKVGLVSMRAMAYGHVTELQRQFPDAEFIEFGPQFGRIRRMRSEEELVYLRKSGYLTDLACEALENNLRPGLTEQDVLSIVYSAYIKNGGDPGIHFIATTNMDNPDRFVPWQRQTSRVLEKGSVVITELTVSYWGYSTQIHRPFAIGKEPSPTYRKLFDAAYAVLRKYPQDLQTRHDQRSKSSRRLRSSKKAALLPTTASFMAKPANRRSSARSRPRTRSNPGRCKKTWCTSSSPIRLRKTSQPDSSSAPRSS